MKESETERAAFRIADSAAARYDRHLEKCRMCQEGRLSPQGYGMCRVGRMLLGTWERAEDSYAKAWRDSVGMATP